MKKKILTIIGARPQFVKAGIVSRKLRNEFDEILVHTGQHYDENMSKLFFDDLKIPKPDYNLNITESRQGKQTALMVIEIEKLIEKEKPDMILVYGDTNSTVAGSLAAVKMHVPIAHVEAGLRSYDKKMPEEVNRVFTDYCSAVLFCPTEISVNNLKKEGIVDNIHKVGDVMYDSTLHYSKIAEEKSDILDKLSLKPKEYFLATVHRQSNTDDKDNIKKIFDAFVESGENIVLPLHPRTKKMLMEFNLYDSYKDSKTLKIINPIGYLDMVVLEKNARKILTDSGGVQKEAFFLDVECITLRDVTEWGETVDSGWNTLTGANKDKILEAIKTDMDIEKDKPDFYGDGDSVSKIVKVLLECAE